MFLGIWGAKAKYLKGAEEIIPGIWGDQCIIFRE